MTTDSATARRVFHFGKPRPNAMIGRDREPGEIGVLVGVAAAGVVGGLILPWLPLRILVLVGAPLVGAAVVWLPYRDRTVYRWYEVDRSHRRLLRTGAASYRSAAAEAGTRLNQQEVEIGAPPGIGRIHWSSAGLDDGALGVVPTEVRQG